MVKRDYRVKFIFRSKPACYQRVLLILVHEYRHCALTVDQNKGAFKKLWVSGSISPLPCKPILQIVF